MSFFKHDQALVDEGARVGEGTRVWAFAHIQDGAVVGSGCNICNGSFIEKGAVVGNNCTIKHNVSIFDGAIIEDDVFIASNIAFINDRYPRANQDDDFEMEKTVVKKGASLGSNSVIMCGVTIGEYAIVAAGSVVLQDVPPHTLVCGNPAKSKGHVCQCARKLDKDLKCSCGKSYVLKDEGLQLNE